MNCWTIAFLGIILFGIPLATWYDRTQSLAARIAGILWAVVVYAALIWLLPLTWRG